VLIPNSVVRVTVRSVALMAVAASLAACGNDEPASPEELLNGKTIPAAAPGGDVAVGAAGACHQVDAPMLDIESRNDTEPQLRIPQPPGWERFTRLDSEILRFALANRNLVANQFAPNVVVTLENGPDADPQVIFDQTRDNVVKMAGAKDVAVKAGTVCGLPAETVTYIGAAMGPAMPARPITALQVVTKTGGQTYLVTATMQTTQPDNPTYQRDVETILTGFHVLPPAYRGA
jgi:hypothetical protein